MKNLTGTFPLAGAIDIHGEAASIDVLELAHKEQLRAVVIKWPGGADSAPAAVFANNTNNGVTRFFGGVVLDRTVGGMNPHAVASSAKSGGIFVWMPTVDALHHRRINDLSEEGAVHVLDSNGRVLPEVREVLKEIAEQGLNLGTGHLSSADAEAVTESALEVGVKCILLNHPLLLGFDMETLKRITDMSKQVFVEHCYVPNHPKPFDIRRILHAVETIGLEQSLIADFGDYGQVPNIADALLDSGMPIEIIQQLAADQPAKVIGLAND